MTNDQTGRTPRQTTGGSPAASTIMIIVTVVAVVIGFFILKTIRDDGGSSGGATPTSASGNTTSTTIAGGSTTAAPTTLPADVKTGTQVQVANASGVGGAAGKLTTSLQSAGFEMAKATDATGAKLATTVVYYDATNPVALSVAQTAARTMGAAAPAQLPSPVPVSGGKLADGAGVLVMLGKDLAGKDLPTTTAAAGGAATTVAGATTTTAG